MCRGEKLDHYSKCSWAKQIKHIFPQRAKHKVMKNPGSLMKTEVAFVSDLRVQ